MYFIIWVRSTSFSETTLLQREPFFHNVLYYQQLSIAQYQVRIMLTVILSNYNSAQWHKFGKLKIPSKKEWRNKLMDSYGSHSFHTANTRVSGYCHMYRYKWENQNYQNILLKITLMYLLGSCDKYGVKDWNLHRV